MCSSDSSSYVSGVSAISVVDADVVVESGPTGRARLCCRQNPPASTDEQHRRAGRLPRLRWALVPRATARNALAHVLIARACHLTYTWSGRCWIASTSFLHGKHVNIKFEPRSALKLFWESAQGSRLTHGLLQVHDNMGILLHQNQVNSIYDSLGFSPHNRTVLRVI